MWTGLNNIKSWIKDHQMLLRWSAAAVVIIAVCLIEWRLLHNAREADRDEMAAQIAKETVKQAKEANKITDNANQNWKQKQKESANETKTTESAITHSRTERDRLLDSITGVVKHLPDSTRANGGHDQ